MYDMLRALANRGPDSAGVALYSPPRDEWVLQIKLGEKVAGEQAAKVVEERVAAVGRVLDTQITEAYMRVVVAGDAEPQALIAAVEEADATGGERAEVVSLGHSLEIVKQVGSPEYLDATFNISSCLGTHAVGHTRMSTESRIDLSHSQPFWAHGKPDLAIVHNGHVTNYHRLRRQYEERGIHFYTENDSEIIGIYLADRMEAGDSFEEALHRSLYELDGAFCYLAATPDGMAYVKDPFSFKPLMVAETDEWVAIATEEMALCSALPGTYNVYEPAAHSVHLWSLAGEKVTA